MRKLKLVFFGATRALAICRAAGLFDDERAEITGVCDFFPAALNAFKTEAESRNCTRIRYTSDPEELLNMESDAAVLCNYATEHAPWAIRYLENGKHVLSELLPMQTLSQAVQLVETVEKTGLVYNYAENYCHMPTTREMRRLYREGCIGEVMAAESVFINDLSKNWARLTHGDPNSWRNHAPSTFYCTHSIGPLMYITGRRAVRVNGIEIPTHETLRKLGARAGSAAMEIMQLDNGGMAKSLHGNLKHPYTPSYSLYCTKGSVESGKYNPWEICLSREMDFEEKHRYGQYTNNVYTPKEEAPRNGINAELGYSVYYTVQNFIGSILGDEAAKNDAIDVYMAMDMALPGFLAYRSILLYGQPFDVPDFRKPEEREKYRFDTSCTDPKVAGSMLLPTKHGTPTEVPDGAYERCKEMFERGETDFW